MWRQHLKCRELCLAISSPLLLGMDWPSKGNYAIFAELSPHAMQNLIQVVRKSNYCQLVQWNPKRKVRVGGEVMHQEEEWLMDEILLDYIDTSSGPGLGHADNISQAFLLHHMDEDFLTQRCNENWTIREIQLTRLGSLSLRPKTLPDQVHLDWKRFLYKAIFREDMWKKKPRALKTSFWEQQKACKTNLSCCKVSDVASQILHFFMDRI